MPNLKNSLNLKSNDNTPKKSIYSRSQVDSLIKKEKKPQKENLVKNISDQTEKNKKKNKIEEVKLVTTPTKKEDSSVDDNRRTFMKVAGIAGIGLAASAILPKQANAYVAGSTPTSNVVGIKNVANAKINPATEDTLGSVKTQTDKLTFDGSNNLLTKSASTVSNIAGTQINPATEETLANVGVSVNDQSIWMLRKILTLLKPLGMTTGAGSNRLSIDINALPTLATVTTVGTVTNLAYIGNVNSFSLMKDTSRNAYANGIRGNLTFT